MSKKGRTKSPPLPAPAPTHQRGAHRSSRRHSSHSGRQSEGIVHPGPHDVMLGRGGQSNHHSGNLAFRIFIVSYKDLYQTAPRNRKPDIAMRVVQDWRNLDPPGRFLTRTDPDRADSLWHDVGDVTAQKRALKNLGERGEKSRPQGQELTPKSAANTNGFDPRKNSNQQIPQLSSSEFARLPIPTDALHAVASNNIAVAHGSQPTGGMAPAWETLQSQVDLLHRHQLSAQNQTHSHQHLQYQQLQLIARQESSYIQLQQQQQQQSQLSSAVAAPVPAASQMALDQLNSQQSMTTEDLNSLPTAASLTANAFNSSGSKSGSDAGGSPEQSNSDIKVPD